MKTTLLALFLFVSVASFGQTATNTQTVSQDALKTFEAGWVTLDYNAMTSTQKLSHIQTWLGLKVQVAKELETNRQIQEAQTAQEIANQLALIEAKRQQMITYLMAQGFKCDNSLEDWYKLYNKPSVFGSNWKAQADYQMSLSTGIDYFLNVAYTLWKELNK